MAPAAQQQAHSEAYRMHVVLQIAEGWLDLNAPDVGWRNGVQ